MEEWRVINGYPNYEVSNLGKVRSYVYRTAISPIPHLLSPRIDHNGYHFVNLYNSNHKMKSVKLHRIVATAFIPNPNNYPQINHLNENKSDNRVENLEWCTAKHNVNYGTTHFRSCMTRRKCCTKEVFQFTPDGKYIQSFYSCSEASRKTGVNLSCIASAAKHVSRYAGDWLWSYTLDYDFTEDTKYLSKLSKFKNKEVKTVI